MKIEEYTFKKTNGDVRTILGTRDFKSLEKCNEMYVKPQGLRKKFPNVTVFWDLKADMFKSYVTENLISKREVKKGFKRVRIENKDFYNKRVGTPTVLKKGKSPYFVLSILNAFEHRTKTQIVDSMTYISEKLDISKNQKRTVQRILTAFHANNVIYKTRTGKYGLTDEGREFLSQNVE